MVAAKWIKADTGVVEVLSVERAGVDIDFTAPIDSVPDSDYELDPGIDELLVYLLDYAGGNGIGIVAIIRHGPLCIRDDPEGPWPG